LNQALVNAEVTEVSNKTILQELQDARATITRLTAHHARSIGWDTRLSAAMKERDDMQQERDAETHRARLAESRFAVLKDKTGTYHSCFFLCQQLNGWYQLNYRRKCAGFRKAWKRNDYQGLNLQKTSFRTHVREFSPSAIWYLLVVYCRLHSEPHYSNLDLL
jgi:hypothetical protein